MTANDIIQSVQDLVNDVTPRFDISDLLYKHKCSYLLSLYSNKYSKQLLLEKVVNNAAIKERYTALKPLFENNDLSYAVIKGAVLSKVAYGNKWVRISGDIDLLVRKQDSDSVKSILLNNGFVQGRVADNMIVPFSRREILFQTAMSHQTAPYVKATESKLCPYINVDINTDIIWGESTEKTDMNFVLSHITQEHICGITVNKLTAEMEFVSLCLHHYKDMNSLYLLSTKGLHLNLFCDIFYYLKANQLDKELLLQISDRLNVSKYIYYCLFFTDQIFDSPVLKEYLNLFEIAKDAVIMETYGLSDDERKVWNISFLERLFHSDLSEYLHTYMTEKDLEKVKSNQLYM